MLDFSLTCIFFHFVKKKIWILFTIICQTKSNIIHYFLSFEASVYLNLLNFTTDNKLMKFYQEFCSSYIAVESLLTIRKLNSISQK